MRDTQKADPEPQVRAKFHELAAAHLTQAGDGRDRGGGGSLRRMADDGGADRAVAAARPIIVLRLNKSSVRRWADPPAGALQTGDRAFRCFNPAVSPGYRMWLFVVVIPSEAARRAALSRDLFLLPRQTRIGPSTSPSCARLRSGMTEVFATCDSPGRQPGGGRHETVTGMSPEETQDFLQDLTERITQPQFCYTHEYKKGDLLIIDDRASFHKAAIRFRSQPASAPVSDAGAWRPSLLRDAG